MYPSKIIGYQDPLSWTFSKVHLTPICELVILYQPCSKISNLHQAPHVCVIPWVSSELVQGLHTWFCLSCVSTPTGCKCLFESCLVSHDVSIYCMMELRTSLYVSIRYPRHHSSWADLPFLHGRFCTNDVAVFIILFFIFELSSLVLRNKSHSSLLVGNYVRHLSYKSNAFVWLETFHKEYSY